MICTECNEREVFVKKRKLCQRCYMRLYMQGKIQKNNEPRFTSELSFVKNYFTHNNWIYEPVTFHLDKDKYTPDFYDAKRNIFIEVVGTKTAYYENKDKYAQMADKFPKIVLEIRTLEGKLLTKG